jgi:hypothetical protein
MKGRKQMKTVTRSNYVAFVVLILAIGTLTVNGAVNDLFVSVNGTGNNGGGFIYKYTPNGAQSTFAAGLSRPRGVASTSSATCMWQSQRQILVT